MTFYKDVTMLLRGSGYLCLKGGVLYNADVTIEGENIYLMPGTTIINSDVNINTGQ